MPVLSRIEVRAMQRGEQRGKLLEDITRLKQLHEQAITISSLADFQRLLD